MKLAQCVMNHLQPQLCLLMFPRKSMQGMPTLCTLDVLQRRLNLRRLLQQLMRYMLHPNSISFRSWMLRVHTRTFILIATKLFEISQTRLLPWNGCVCGGPIPLRFHQILTVSGHHLFHQFLPPHNTTLQYHINPCHQQNTLNKASLLPGLKGMMLKSQAFVA